MSEKVINILLVEDDDLDVIDIQRTLGKMNIMHKATVAKNGEEAIDFLKEHERPDVVLLDLNMPKMNGMEFLSTIRKHDAYRDLKVFVLTTSDDQMDKQAARTLGVSGYIVKPLKFNNPSSMDSFNLMIDLLNLKRPSNF